MWWLYMLKYTSIVKLKYVCICIYILCHVATMFICKYKYKYNIYIYIYRHILCIYKLTIMFGCVYMQHVFSCNLSSPAKIVHEEA